MILEEILPQLRSQGLTFCGRPGKLEVLIAAVKKVEERAVPGRFLEAGVAMGGSAIVIAAAKSAGRGLDLYDVFEMLPPPGANDDPKSHQAYEYFVKGDVQGLTNVNYVRHASNLLAFVRENMARFGIDPERDGIAFHKGLYADTLRPDGPVAFAHVDCDWYDSVVTCLERIVPHVPVGGVLVFDDYNSFSGCRRAVDAWLAADRRFRILHQDWTIAIERAD